MPALKLGLVLAAVETAAENLQQVAAEEQREVEEETAQVVGEEQQVREVERAPMRAVAEEPREAQSREEACCPLRQEQAFALHHRQDQLRPSFGNEGTPPLGHPCRRQLETDLGTLGKLIHKLPAHCRER